MEPARPSKKSTEEVLKRVARPAWRSPLFWWLVEHHDAVRRDEAETGRGVPWRELCVDFVGMGITLADGRPVKPATAKKIWQRVRKEVVRVEQRRAQERAEREARRPADPRQNMPVAVHGLVPGAPGGSSAASGDDIVDGEAAGDEHSTRPESGRPRRGGKSRPKPPASDGPLRRR